MKKTFTQEELEQGWYENTDENMICPNCKEHCSPTYSIEDNEYMGSSCCGV